MSKRKHSGLPKGAFEVHEDVNNLVELLKSAVEEGDVGAVGRLMQDEAINHDWLRDQCPDIYLKGYDLFASWRFSIRVKDVIRTWHPQYYEWYTTEIKEDRGESNFFVHYKKFPKTYDEVINVSLSKVLPLPKKTKSKKERKIYFEMIEETVAPSTSFDMPAEIDEESAFKSASGRLLRGTAKRTSLDGAAADRSSLGGDGVQESGTSSTTTTSSKATGKGGRKKQDPNERLEDDADWVCFLCKQMEAEDGSNLLLCEGGCKRSFHFKCLGLDEVPTLRPQFHLTHSHNQISLFCRLWQVLRMLLRGAARSALPADTPVFSAATRELTTW
jgi:hypothetical protein